VLTHKSAKFAPQNVWCQIFSSAILKFRYLESFFFLASHFVSQTIHKVLSCSKAEDLSNVYLFSKSNCKMHPLYVRNLVI
jgi:hypothetical protein